MLRPRGLTNFPRLVRFMRMRPPQVLPKQKPAITKEQSKPIKKVPDVSFEEAGNLLKKGGAVSKPSRFKSKSEQRQQTLLERIPELKNKRPAQIERELKERFASDGIDYDPAFVQEMVETSKEAEVLMADTLQGGNMLEQVSQEEMTNLLDWIIADGESRLATQAGSGERIEEYAEKMQMDKADNEGITDAVVSSYKMADELQENGLEKLPEFLEILNRPDNSAARAMTPLPKILRLFDLSTQLIDDDVREECIYLAGNLIYSSTNARADPINEKFYIESLMNHGKFDKALELFETRREKPDVEDMRFWPELGATVLLSKGTKKSALEAERLALEVKQQYGYIHPILITAFVERLLSVGEKEKAVQWWNQMKQEMDELGLVDTIEVPETQLLDNPQDVYDYHNRVDPISWDNITDVVFALLKYRCAEEAMSVVETATKRDKGFLPHFIEYLKENSTYPGREFLLLTLEKPEVAEKFHPAILQFLKDELNSDRPVRSKSLEEVLVLDELSGFLERSLKNPYTGGQQKMLAGSILSSISVGAKLTSEECKEVLYLLLKPRSRRGDILTAKIIREANKSLERERNGERTGMFPSANSHMYLVLVQMFARRRNPQITEIEELLRTMISLRIPILNVLAQQVVVAYKKARQYTKALEFVDDFLETQEQFKPTSDFFRIVMQTYRKSIMDSDVSQEVQQHRLERLRWMFKTMLESPGWEFDDEFLQETVLTFMTFGDLQSAICALQFQGMVLKRDITNDLMLAIKLKLENSVSKSFSQLPKEKQAQLADAIEQFRRDCGLLSVKGNLKSDKVYNWRDAAGVLARYLEGFHYKPYLNELDQNPSDQEIEENRDRFNHDLHESQDLYNLPEVNVETIT